MPTAGLKEKPLKKKAPLIQIRGACEHNLKNLSVDIPRNKLIVITGPSGSGKSSLAFDTLFAEGQRRYIESLSAYAKQFLTQLKKPDVESISGLCPAIAIQQKVISKNPRSTVGTVTEIYDFLRLLYSRIGEAETNLKKEVLATQSASEVTDQLMLLKKNSRISLMAVIAEQKKGEFAKEIEALVESGMVHARIDGINVSLQKEMKLKKTVRHTVYAFVDRLIVQPKSRLRIHQAVQSAANLGNGQVKVEIMESDQVMSFFVTDASGKGLELSPKLFSFNSPAGACPKCRGLGYLGGFEEDEEYIYEDEEFDLSKKTCPACQGLRLKEATLSVLVAGKNIAELHAMSVLEAIAFFKDLHFSGNRALIAEKILKELRARLSFLQEVGLEYLHLSRLSGTLSGGEEQRVRLATQLGTHLTGVLYILDEPSIGLHQVDNDRLISSLKKLKDSGNTVVVVEHDIDTMLAADYLIDLGPGAGRNGGELVDFGTPQEVTKGLTADYLRHKKEIALPKQRRKGSKKQIQIQKANLNNLRKVNATIPLETFTVVTGVSGSGKSSLVMDVLYKTFYEKKVHGCLAVKGFEHIDKLIRVTQSPIGRTSRSNPATYIDLFGPIRTLFSQTTEARKRGYTAGRFSFNTKGGRCDKCEGGGELKIEMHFLPGVRVQCDVCYGRRFNSDTLSVLFKGRNIYDVLEMTFNQAQEFFGAIPQLNRKVQVVCEVGLGYLKLGQPAPTLSGGEAQRVKLAKELSKRSTGKTLYVLDEPTTGLHLVDIDRLLEVCNRLVDLGNTVVMIEHQLDVIKCADHIIDMGPGGGIKGGEIVAAGTPEEVTKFVGSATGRYLKPLLK